MGGGGGFRGSNNQRSWNAVKRLDRLAPTSADSSGNGYRINTSRSSIPQGGILGGFMGSTIQKTGKFGQTTGPIGNQFCTFNADESGNGHRLNKLTP